MELQPVEPMDAADTADIYEITLERHRAAATVVTSNREPADDILVLLRKMPTGLAAD